MRSTTKATVEKARKLRRAMTQPEVMLWQHLRAYPHGLKFRRQHPIGPYVADFYCPTAGLIVEVDGSHHDVETIAERDAARDAFLAGRGILVLRVPAKELYDDLGAVLAGIHSQAETSPSTSPSPAATGRID